ncbi:hypothetical protein SAMN05192559_107217 [Halobacillus karajensis]|nr:hypothetical protein SAMN05192559_107217 [Halobacillus karajensis]
MEDICLKAPQVFDWISKESNFSYVLNYQIAA